MHFRKMTMSGVAGSALLMTRRAAWGLLFLLAVVIGAVVVHVTVSESLDLFHNPRGQQFGPVTRIPIDSSEIDDVRDVLMAFAKENGFAAYDHAPAIAAQSGRRVLYIEMVRTSGDLRVWAGNIIDAGTAEIGSFQLEPSTEAMPIARKLVLTLRERWPALVVVGDAAENGPSARSATAPPASPPSSTMPPAPARR
jgi:hypothetical protein